MNLIEIPRSNVGKEDIAIYAANMISLVEEGEADPLELHIKAKALTKALSILIDKTEESTWIEAKKYGGKSFEAFGATIQLKEGADTADLDIDPILRELKAKVKDREELLKQAYKMKGKGEIVDPSTGEFVPALPPKPTKSSIAITFK
jgi:hypothetical protein